LFVLNLIAEFLLQPFLAVLAMVAAVAERDERSRSVKKLVDGFLALIGFTLLAFVLGSYTSTGGTSTSMPHHSN